MLKNALRIVLLLTSNGLVPIKSAWADPVALTSEALRNNVLASRISVCSEVSGVDQEAISLFYSKYFNGWSAPLFGAPVDESAYRVGENILFIASDGQVGSQLRECLAKYELVSDNLEEFVGKHARRLGKGIGALEGVSLPTYYGSVSASWAYQKVGNWLVISFMSKEEQPYRVQHALTNLFGLSITVCESNAAC